VFEITFEVSSVFLVTGHGPLHLHKQVYSFGERINKTVDPDEN
jgi:hypothetical protein